MTLLKKLADFGDWYYIFSILPLGVYPRSPDIYNVHKIIKFFVHRCCVLSTQVKVKVKVKVEDRKKLTFIFVNINTGKEFYRFSSFLAIKSNS
jgi:hypothetical protein